MATLSIATTQPPFSMTDRNDIPSQPPTASISFDNLVVRSQAYLLLSILETVLSRISSLTSSAASGNSSVDQPSVKAESTISVPVSLAEIATSAPAEPVLVDSRKADADKGRQPVETPNKASGGKRADSFMDDDEEEERDGIE